jgi:hypothetical protein
MLILHSLLPSLINKKKGIQLERGLVH